MKAGEIVKVAAEVTGGGGGGRDTMAQAGGRDPDKLPEALAAARAAIEAAPRELMRVLALDYGSARCGCAVSDPTGTLATPLAVVERPGTRKGPGAARRAGARARGRARRRRPAARPRRRGGRAGRRGARVRRAPAARARRRRSTLYDERLTTAWPQRTGGARRRGLARRRPPARGYLATAPGDGREARMTDRSDPRSASRAAEREARRGPSVRRRASASGAAAATRARPDTREPPPEPPAEPGSRGGDADAAPTSSRRAPPPARAPPASRRRRDRASRPPRSSARRGRAARRAPRRAGDPRGRRERSARAARAGGAAVDSPPARGGVRGAAAIGACVLIARVLGRRAGSCSRSSSRSTATAGRRRPCHDPDGRERRRDRRPARASEGVISTARSSSSCARRSPASAATSSRARSRSREDMSYGAALDALTKARRRQTSSTVTIPEGRSRARDRAAGRRRPACSGNYVAADAAARRGSTRALRRARAREPRGLPVPGDLRAEARRDRATTLVAEQLDDVQAALRDGRPALRASART